MTRCSVANCNNKVKFKFPKNYYACRKWLQAIKKPTFRPISSDGLCSKHFAPEDILTESKVAGHKLKHLRLKLGAIPKVFLDENEELPYLQEKNNNNNQGISRTSVSEDHKTNDLVSFKKPKDSDVNLSCIRFNDKTCLDSHEEKDLPVDELDLQGSENSNYKSVSCSENYESDSLVTDSCLNAVVDVCEQIVNNEYYEDESNEASVKIISSNCVNNDDVKTFIDANKKSIGTQTYNVTRFDIEDFKHDPRSVLLYTGLENYEKFMAVFHSLSPALQYLKYETRHIGDLSMPNQLFLVLWKLRRIPADLELANNFKISTAAVGNLFKSWIKFMNEVWSLIDIWPSRELIDYYMPSTFKKHYPKTRVIVDASEIKIEGPSNPRHKQAVFSNYKNAYTLKVVVGSSPRGMITYHSPLYGRSTSDRQVMERSNLKLESGDEILADKGFNVEDLYALKGLKVTIPTILKGINHLPHKTVLKDRKLSKHRIHIKRMIGLLKTYRILSTTLNHLYTPLATEIVAVCIMLCNFKNNIMKQ